MRSSGLAFAALTLGLFALPCGAEGQEAPAPRNPHVRLHGQACTACHTTSGWRAVSFDHRGTHFALLGQHQAVPCAGCHDLTDFRGAPAACGSCHADPHRGDAGQQCEHCHAETGWQAVSPQNAHARTRLPDLGVHAALRCEDCHRQTGAQQFTGRVAQCVACHQATYDATTNPPHHALGFATQCETCHQFTTWTFALFSGHDAIFPIYSGGHAGRWRDCASCHANASDYRVFSCTTCHGQAQTDPRHQGITGYQWLSSACLTCHPDGSGGTFAQHDAIFPIFSGTHSGRWSACTDCHTDPTTRAVFSCMTGTCHAQTVTTQAHTGVPGYTYTAAQCLSCHPTGAGGNFTQHDANYFPIYSGTHAARWTACSDCHTDPTNPQTFSCMTGTCHPATTTNGTHLGIPGYAYTAAQCRSCHPTGAAGTFTQHDALFFPIYSGTHANRWTVCGDCHTDPTTRQSFSCMTGSCHPASQTNSNHSGVNGYQYVAAQCYACHPQGRGGGIGPVFPNPRPPVRPLSAPRVAEALGVRGRALPPVAWEYLRRWESGGAPARP